MPYERKTDVVYHLLRQSLFEQSLLFVEGAIGRKGSLIDLGAGHCAFSRMAHAMGWKATAMDVRSVRVPPDLPAAIPFIHGDIMGNEWRPEDYDVIVCLGVYYHLDQSMQHRLLDRLKGRPFILDTHFANPAGVPTRYDRQVGPTIELNGETGAIYGEAPKLDEEKRKTDDPRASFDNPTSWWQTKDSLLETLHQKGYPNVWTFDYKDMDYIQRTFFVGVPIDQRSKGISGIRI